MTDQQQLSTQTDASDTDSIEELPRDETTDVAASHPKSERTINLGPALVNTRPWQHFLAFVLLAGIDLAMNAAAGRAAASVGARLNRAPVTPKVLRIGALAGITKSALTTFYEVVSRMGVNLAFSILLLLVFMPKELLIAALIAAIPLYFETIRLIEPKPDANGGTS
ncbi:hypothetical protein BU26DRAFT_559703 [Trematosphaeria pertusa]|uniref:Uncharacterized protein n=1 Tax=Trematosphaeria pertusa TaxID=390896 RepID=A0A6A6IXP0_9PLEO|nr:uncharacterized protein BU26DRAFT_559703 [Trematosphaeria pertusa]KAF2255078.1 hypothetical protein BU26DRAFT_559703 [Trematosphaeria pertusa]